MNTVTLSRRDFLKVSTAAGASLVITFTLGGCGSQTPVPVPGPTDEPTATPRPLPAASPTPSGPVLAP
ncbi:MAG: twin-arginine translocation signal domain-containing protein, partial [Rudaea sp.]